MRKYFIALFLSLILLFSFPSDSNAACQGLPDIPVTIIPAEGNFNTNYLATIMWEELTPAEFARYRDIDVYLGLFDAQGTLVPAGTDNIDRSYGRKQNNSQHTLGNLLLVAGKHQLNLHLFPTFGTGKNFSCIFEKESPIVEVTSTFDPNDQTASTLKAGDVCDPNLQNQIQFSCPEGNTCNPTGGTSNSKWACGDPEGSDNADSVDNQSLLPCSKWAYAYPTDSPDFRLNNVTIPTGNPEYVNPDFKTRKCIAVNTAIGNINTDPQGFVRRIFELVLGLAGGIALILIMVSGYKFMVSQGNPEKVTAARDELTSAVIGLLFIIFSFVILQIIGVNILRIPGFQP